MWDPRISSHEFLNQENSFPTSPFFGLGQSAVWEPCQWTKHIIDANMLMISSTLGCHAHFLYPKCCIQLTDIYANVITRSIEISHGSVTHIVYIFVCGPPVEHS